jgi:hypothetical protein
VTLAYARVTAMWPIIPSSASEFCVSFLARTFALTVILLVWNGWLAVISGSVR